MKIGPLDSKPPVAPAAPERKGSASVTPPAADVSARVELSQAAATLSTPAGEASFDGAKVERIAQAIRDGKFTVNPEAIADKLIVNAEELLGRKPN